MKVTEIQKRVLQSMAPDIPLNRPRGSLERLAKKGLVAGDRRVGWKLTPKGFVYIHAGSA